MADSTSINKKSDAQIHFPVAKMTCGKTGAETASN
jgi:hypothetical protein